MLLTPRGLGERDFEDFRSLNGLSEVPSAHFDLIESLSKGKYAILEEPYWKKVQTAGGTEDVKVIKSQQKLVMAQELNYTDRANQSLGNYLAIRSRAVAMNIYFQSGSAE